MRKSEALVAKWGRVRDKITKWNLFFSWPSSYAKVYLQKHAQEPRPIISSTIAPTCLIPSICSLTTFRAYRPDHWFPKYLPTWSVLGHTHAIIHPCVDICPWSTKLCIHNCTNETSKHTVRNSSRTTQRELQGYTQMQTRTGPMGI